MLSNKKIITKKTPKKIKQLDEYLSKKFLDKYFKSIQKLNNK